MVDEDNKNIEKPDDPYLGEDGTDSKGDELSKEERRLASLQNDNPGKTGVVEGHPPVAPPVFDENEPQISVRSPEGVVLTVPASQQGQYEEMGFEILVDSGRFGPHGTLTDQADPHYVAMGDAARKEAARRR